MIKYEIDDEGWAHLEVDGTPVQVAADVCTLIARIMSHLNDKQKRAFRLSITEFLVNDDEHELVYKSQEDIKNERE